MLYRTRTLLVPLGDDFRWDGSAEWSAQLENYDKLFAHFRERPDLHVQAGWGTLKEYFDTVTKIFFVDFCIFCFYFIFRLEKRKSIILLQCLFQ